MRLSPELKKKDNAYRRELVLLLCGVLLLLACAVTMARLSPEHRSHIQTRHFGKYGFSDNVILSAVLIAIDDMGYDIQSASRSEGFIETAPLMFAPGTLDGLVVGQHVPRGRGFTVGRTLETVKKRCRMQARVKNGTVVLHFVFEKPQAPKPSKLPGLVTDSGWETTEVDTIVSNPLYRQAFRLIESSLLR